MMGRFAGVIRKMEDELKHLSQRKWAYLHVALEMDMVGSKASVQVALVGTAVLAMVAMVWVLVVKVAEMGRCTRCRSLDQSTRPVGPQRSCPRRSCTIGCLCGTETNTLRAGYCRHRTG